MDKLKKERGFVFLDVIIGLIIGTIAFGSLLYSTQVIGNIVKKQHERVLTGIVERNAHGREIFSILEAAE